MFENKTFFFDVARKCRRSGGGRQLLFSVGKSMSEVNCKSVDDGTQRTSVAPSSGQFVTNDNGKKALGD